MLLNTNAIDLILRGDYDVLIHPCNTTNRLGYGINKAVSSTFKEMGLVDYNLYKMYKKNLLSLVGSSAYKIFQTKEGKKFAIVNAYVKWEPGHKKYAHKYYKQIVHYIMEKFGTTKKYLLAFDESSFLETPKELKDILEISSEYNYALCLHREL